MKGQEKSALNPQHLYIGYYKIDALLYNQYREGKLLLDVLVKNESLSNQKARVQILIYDEYGDLLAEMLEDIYVDSGQDHQLQVEYRLGPINPWSSENPYLYELEAILIHDEIKTDRIFQSIGFRTIEIFDKRLHINGKSLNIKGVNLINNHISQEEESLEIAIREIKLLKDHHINSVRLDSSCPSILFSLCATYGLYVIMVAGIQVPDLIKNTTCTENKDASLLIIMKNMYQEYKNDACIIAWSLGNDSNITDIEANKWLKETEKHRPILLQTNLYRNFVDVDWSQNSTQKLSNLKEVKKVFQPINFLWNNLTQELTISNNYLFTAVSDFDLYWKVIVNDQIFHTDSIKIYIEPRQTIILPAEKLKLPKTPIPMGSLKLEIIDHSGKNLGVEKIILSE